MSTTTHSLVIALLPAIGKGSKEPPAAGRFRSRRAALLVLVSGLCCMIEIASAASHRFVDLGTLGGATSYGFGLNEVGQVVGRGYRPF